MRTIETNSPTAQDIENQEYSYQTELTSKLDQLNTDFDQAIINEIVLWKVNRYAAIGAEMLHLINQIKSDDTVLNPNLTRTILQGLLCKEQKGIRLPLASTILRFKNPGVYQIIDQRVYRFLYGEELNLTNSNVEKQIETYLNYLQSLRQVCEKHAIDFKIADRVFYSMDKHYNRDEKVKW